jgi:epoxyqueuosine reductase
MEKTELTRLIKEEAYKLGFALAGITTPDPPDHLDQFTSWLALGYHGAMEWIAGDDSRVKRAHPLMIMPECQSILVLAIPYPHPRGNLHGGNIAAYALNQDYHLVLEKRLQLLVQQLERWVGAPVPNRWYTDTGPILEKELARRAGLGWIGKNTLLINRENGSYFLLAEILLGIELLPDLPHAESFCGSCTRCLETCPTGALVAPYILDAGRCTSYLTIENREEIPLDLRSRMGDWVFGCDICQLVCPWNKPGAEFTGILEELQPREELVELDLIAELKLTQDEFSARFRGSPIKRAKRRGFLRSIAVALGNREEADAVPALTSALEDEEELVRGHAAWALGRIGGSLSRQALEAAAQKENHPAVRDEINRALERIKNTQGG